MKFNMILAVDDKNWLWKNNDLAWRISEDLKYFKKKTTSWDENVVIMWRKTWESIPEKYRPLPNRVNCVLTRGIWKYKNTDSIKYFNDFDKCLDSFKNNESVFLMWWATLYNKYLSHENLNEVYLTKVKWDFDCDVFFDGVPDDFELISDSGELEENNMKYNFLIYKRIS